MLAEGEKCFFPMNFPSPSISPSLSAQAQLPHTLLSPTNTSVVRTAQHPPSSDLPNFGLSARRTRRPPHSSSHRLSPPHPPTSPPNDLAPPTRPPPSGSAAPEPPTTPQHAAASAPTAAAPAQQRLVHAGDPRHQPQRPRRHGPRPDRRQRILRMLAGFSRHSAGPRGRSCGTATTSPPRASSSSTSSRFSRTSSGSSSSRGTTAAGRAWPSSSLASAGS